MVEPKPHEYVGVNHARYNGRDFYGDHADDMAELNYLRDWKRWAERRIKNQSEALTDALHRELWREP